MDIDERARIAAYQARLAVWLERAKHPDQEGLETALHMYSEVMVPRDRILLTTPQIVELGQVLARHGEIALAHMRSVWTQTNLDDPRVKADPHTRAGVALECYTMALCCFALAGDLRRLHSCLKVYSHPLIQGGIAKINARLFMVFLDTLMGAEHCQFATTDELYGEPGHAAYF